MICHACHTALKLVGIPTRGDVCPNCDADLHCCLNCHNYDPAAHNRCREPHAEWVPDREKANFCDLFLPNKLTAGRGAADLGDEARRSFENLFKK